MGSPGGSDPRIADLSMISFADISLQKIAKQLGAAEADLFAKGQSGMLPVPTRRFHCRPVPLPDRSLLEISLLRRCPMR
jgi:hypothetical protein